MLTDSEVASILAEAKVITANVRWRPVGGRSGEAYYLEATVLAPIQDVTLWLKGYKGRRNRSLALIYKGFPIKKITVHNQHTNPDGYVLRQPHKHAWNEAHDDREAYIPTDITFGDINVEFTGFLRQCNINLLGTYSAIMP